VTIDDLWESLGPFDLVKIDAEGSEDKILQGFSLNEVSPRRNIYVVIEMRPATMTFCLKWLKRNSLDYFSRKAGQVLYGMESSC
jgi:hypothetical protein